MSVGCILIYLRNNLIFINWIFIYNTFLHFLSISCSWDPELNNNNNNNKKQVSSSSCFRSTTNKSYFPVFGLVPAWRHRFQYGQKLYIKGLNWHVVCNCIQCLFYVKKKILVLNIKSNWKSKHSYEPCIS